MLSKICYESELDDARTCFKRIQDMFGELEQILKHTTTKLEDNCWQGKSKDTCVEANGILKAYGTVLKPYFENMEKCLDALDEDINLFCSNSRNVNSIKRW